MKSLFFVLAALAAVAFASDVLDLTDETFHKTISDNELVMVEFYAPWCGHCKNLAPKYETAATNLKEIAPLAKVDCTEEQDLCQSFGVRGYPTLKVFRNGKPKDYEGQREADAITGYIKKQVLPVVSALDKDSMAKFIDSERVFVVGFFDADSEEAKTFKAVAEDLRDDAVFGSLADADVAKEQGASYPSVVLFKSFDEKKNVHDGEFEYESVVEFIETNSVPLMDEIGPTNYKTYMESGLPLAYFFYADADQKKEYSAPMEAVAKEFKGKINFVYIDGAQFGSHAGNLNLKVGEFPGFVIHDVTDNLKFPFEGEISEDAVRAYTAGVLDKSIQPNLKSAEVPEEQGSVYTVVGKNFNEVVKSDKDVLIEFYAPWCGHCKRLAPIYQELGDALADNDNVIIAQMDATENDLPAGVGFQVQGFPTIKLFTASNKVIDYNGERDLNGFISFLQKNAENGSSVKLPADEDEEDVEEDKPSKDEL